jgi:hypothetical protein
MHQPAHYDDIFREELMPTDLPPEPSWLPPALRVVRFVAAVRDESIARTLLLRFTISNAIATSASATLRCFSHTAAGVPASGFCGWCRHS